MIKIGITGGIGSGKSFISGVFGKLGIPVYNSDTRAKELMNTSPHLIERIQEIFGSRAYFQHQLNRKYIASAVFSDKNLLNKLNTIVHPAVETDFLQWCSSQKDNTYVLKEAAILFESGAYKKLDAVILVSAPEKVRISRVVQRDKTSVDEVKKRINSQWTTEKLISLADFLIENNDNKLILPQIIEIDKKLNSIWGNSENG